MRSQPGRVSEQVWVCSTFRNKTCPVTASLFLNQIKRDPEPPLDKGGEKFTASPGRLSAPRGAGSLSGKGGERPLLFSPPWWCPGCSLPALPASGVLRGATASFLSGAECRGLQPQGPGPSGCPTGTYPWVLRGEGLGEECTPFGLGKSNSGGHGHCSFPQRPQSLDRRSNGPRGFPGGARGKEPTCPSGRRKRHRFDPWAGKIPWRRAQQPTPAFLPSGCPPTEEPGGPQSMGA